MNDAQSTFGFELAALSVPIDAWDLDQRAYDGTPYLWADKLASRLKDMTVELRVNLLACITRHWLRDNNWLNLYGWWPGGQEPPVVIFTCAGFDDLAPAGPETDRAIANVTVTALAGFFGNLDSHTRGAKECPLAFNQDRDLAHLTGRQAFDSRCRARLKKALPKNTWQRLRPCLKPLVSPEQTHGEGEEDNLHSQNYYWQEVRNKSYRQTALGEARTPQGRRLTCQCYGGRPGNAGRGTSPGSGASASAHGSQECCTGSSNGHACVRR
jgi:hypothetical protein